MKGKRFVSLIVLETLLFGLLLACEPGKKESDEEVGEAVSTAPREWQVLGSGSMKATSERFRSEGSLSFVYGGEIRGEKFQLINPEVSVRHQPLEVK